MHLHWFHPLCISLHTSKIPPLGFLCQSWFSPLGGQGVSQLRVTSPEKLPLTPSTHVSHSLTPFQALQLGQHPRCSPWTKRDMSELLLQASGLGARQLLPSTLRGLRHHHQPESLPHLAVVTGGQGAHGTDLTHLSTLNQPVVLWDFIWV